MTIGFEELPIEPSTPDSFLRARGYSVFCAAAAPLVGAPPDDTAVRAWFLRQQRRFQTFLSSEVEPIFVPTDIIPEFVPDSDTIRGGKELITYGDLLFFDTSRDTAFTSVTASPGWSTALVNSGVVRFKKKGVELDTGLTANSSAQLVSTSVSTHGDVAIDVDLVNPTGATSGPVDLAVLEWQAGPDIARVRLRRGFGSDPAATVVFGEVFASGVTTTGGIALAGTNNTLRIVRNGARVWAFVGTRGVDGDYTSLIKVLDIDFFSTFSGVVQFSVTNGALAQRVLSRFKNFTVRSHARVGTRLLDHKRDFAERVVGNVPAATVEELGLVDFVVFGLFGEAIAVDGFEYVLPDIKTVGRRSDATFFTPTDPSLKDET